MDGAVVLILAKTENRCGCSQYILLFKGAKNQMSLFHKIPMVHKFFHACLTLQFRRELL